VFSTLVLKFTVADELPEDARPRYVRGRDGNEVFQEGEETDRFGVMGAAGFYRPEQGVGVVFEDG
jgi:hypothetical protein